MHRDIVKDLPNDRVQRRIGMIEAWDAQAGVFANALNADFLTVFLTDLHDDDHCPFYAGNDLPLVASKEPFVVPAASGIKE